MGTTTVTTGAVFIPEVWSDEIRAQYETYLRLAKCCKSFKHNGATGDVIHVPDISNLVANDMIEDGEVTAQSVTESEFTITLNKWKESSVYISDLAKTQSKYDLRKEYTGKMSYALAKAMETDLFALFANSSFSGYNADGTTEATGGAALTLAGILIGQTLLLGRDVPTTDNYLFITPLARQQALQITAFTSIDYVNKKAVVSGEIGDILGATVVVSTLCPSYTVSTSKTNNILMHKDAVSIAIQKSPRTQSEYQLK
ncbi:MAG: phage capsid protein, partial [Candidatus Bathyarchaeota archaeon]|nr:phage capsid protein [Candidatus Bathyarchaeota archaeon]